MVDKPLRVEVRKGASPPSLYRWEIYRGHARVERSLPHYPTEEAAREAGMQVMARLITSGRTRRP
jgi:hypothetical protein